MRSLAPKFQRIEKFYSETSSKLLEKIQPTIGYFLGESFTGISFPNFRSFLKTINKINVSLKNVSNPSTTYSFPVTLLCLHPM